MTLLILRELRILSGGYVKWWILELSLYGIDIYESGNKEKVKMLM